MRKQKILSCFLTLVIFLVAPLNVYATQISSEMPYRDGDIPADVYELIEEYKMVLIQLGQMTRMVLRRLCLKVLRMKRIMKVKMQMLKNFIT